jgi:nucleoside-triphosphatase THEP1
LNIETGSFSLRLSQRKNTMAPQVGKIAAVLADDGTSTQALLAAIVADWRDSGVKIAGVIGELHGLPDRTCGAGILRDIASGKPYRIYLETPPHQTSCHLDAAGVANACRAALDQISMSDLVVLNKFGKLEGMGEGLAPAFELAISAGKPVLTTVSNQHRDAWRTFAPDTIFLSADKAALQSWWRAIRVPPRHPPHALDGQSRRA